MIETILTVLIILGIATLVSSVTIVTFITVFLFFKEQVCFHEKRKLILTFELLLDICGWLALYFLILNVVMG